MRQNQVLDPPDFLGTFPTDANVRLAVSGLAYCKLASDISNIYFLRHIADHELEMTIYRRRRDESPVVFRPTEAIGTEEAVLIENSMPTVVKNVAAPIEQCEHRLNELINLAYHHNLPINEKAPQSGDAPSVLTVQNFRYYTLELMEVDHTLKMEGAVIAKRKFGYSLGGKLNLSDGETISVKIGEDEEIDLPLQEGSDSWLYDIYFSNHCKLDPDDCHLPGEGQLDFQFYYDVLEEVPSEEDQPPRVLTLEVSGPDDEAQEEQNNLVILDLKVGACNVVLIEPSIPPPEII